ncbi:hypothetical protein TcCL_NonESM12013 [Trypanosoma cruzi]|nr:hypothetical protein TcCL_NonESM12013 [Trypanosoma cruzi]
MLAVACGDCRLLPWHEEKGGEGARTPTLFSSGCDALRVTALSWASCPIEGGMAGNFVATSWMDEVLLPLLPRVVGACSVCVVWWPRCFCHFSGTAGMSWVEMVVDAVLWCVNCAAGPAAISSFCLLSRAASAVPRPSPSCCILFLLSHRSVHWLQRLHYG